MKKRRSLDVFSLSFLDCICCGFGSVILLFVIVNTRTDQAYSTDISKTIPRESHATPLTKAQLKVEEERVKLRLSQTQRENQRIRREISTIETQLTLAIERRDAVITIIESIKNRLENRKSTPPDSQAQMKRLQEQLKVLENEIIKLQAAIQATQDQQGSSAFRRRAGDGHRHYLTGLSLSGRRTLILLDSSASMLSDHIVDILRRRNMNKTLRREAPKWRQSVAAVEWLLSQLPIDGQFQLFAFNETVFPVLQHSAGQWLQASNTKTMEEVSAALHSLAPEKGTNLYKAVKIISEMNPPADNVVLMTDGLPTMGAGPSLFKKVSARQRLNIFKNAIGQIPEAVPINVILYQMEGDPEAASAYWRLAMITRGSFFCPSRDWP